MDGLNNGVITLIIEAINDEWDAIKFYEDMLVNIDDESSKNVVQDILEEEHNHVGMLEELLSYYSPEVEEIDTGEKEAENIIVDEGTDDMKIANESMNGSNENNMDKVGDVTQVAENPFANAIALHKKKEKEIADRLKKAGKEDKDKPVTGQKKADEPKKPVIERLQKGEKLTLNED